MTLKIWLLIKNATLKHCKHYIRKNNFDKNRDHAPLNLRVILQPLNPKNKGFYIHKKINLKKIEKSHDLGKVRYTNTWKKSINIL